MVFVCGARDELLCFLWFFFPLLISPKLCWSGAQRGKEWAGRTDRESSLLEAGPRHKREEGGGLGFLKEGGNAVSVSEERPDVPGCR